MAPRGANSVKQINMIRERICSECPKPLIRQSTECNNNWKKRRTCSLNCRFLRYARLKRESRLKAKQFTRIEVIGEK
jgi:hypothetical protein